MSEPSATESNFPRRESAPSSRDPRDILRARARALAQPPRADESGSATLEVLEFRLAKEKYAAETRLIREVQPLRDLTPLPCTPAFVLGIVNVRGRILPVLDLKRLFDIEDKGLTDLHRIILVHGADLEFGLLADVIVGIRRISADSLQPSLPTLSGIRAEYLKGITADRLVVLDLARILEHPRIVVHEEVVE